MKKTILSLALVASALFASAQTPGLSSTAAFDDFATTEQYGMLTEDTKWDDATNAPVVGEKAFKGIVWGGDAAVLTTNTRGGDGKGVFNITQQGGKYEPFVALFGTYADGTVKKNYTIDLSADATLSFTVKNAGDSIIRVSVQVQDIKDTALCFASTASATGALFYQHQLGFVQGESTPVASGATRTYTVDLKTAIVGEGKDKDIISATGNAKFDYTKVKMVLITVVNDKSNNGNPDWNPKKLDNYPVEISNFKIGDVSTIMPLGLTSDEAAANNNQVVSVYDIMGKFVATGKLKELGLESGKLYVVKSGNKSRKIVMN